jgi:hypothetical protein
MVDGGEGELRHAVERHDVEMGVGYLVARDHHADPSRPERLLLGAPDGLGDLEALGGQRRLEVDPVIDLGAGNHERVTGVHRLDGEERDALRVAPPLFELVTPIPYVQLQQMFDESAPWDMYSYEKAVYLDDLTDGAMRETFDVPEDDRQWIASHGNNEVYLTYKQTGAMMPHHLRTVA